MRRVMILLPLAVALTLPACATSKPSGKVRVPPPDAALVAPCATPEAQLKAGDWKVIAARLGLALIRCGQEKAALAAYVKDVRGVLE